MTRLDQRILKNISFAIHKNYKQYFPFFKLDNSTIRLCGIFTEGYVVKIAFIQLDNDNNFTRFDKEYNCKKKAQRNQLKKLISDILMSLNRTDHIYIDDNILYSQFGCGVHGII